MVSSDFDCPLNFLCNYFQIRQHVLVLYIFDWMMLDNEGLFFKLKETNTSHASVSLIYLYEKKESFASKTESN